jgi:DNA-binding PadR family transcriptional regulator
MTGRARAILYALAFDPATVSTIKEITGRTSFIYGTVRWLEQQGYVESFERAGSMSVMVARGGRPRRYYQLTLAGSAWLRARPREMS